MNPILQHRANVAVANIETARTPLEKHAARREGLAVRLKLEKQIGDDGALAVFKATRPQSAFSMWKARSPRAAGVHDRTCRHQDCRTDCPSGRHQSRTKPAGQIVVPMPMVAAMTARGFVRANSVITHLDAVAPDLRTPAYRRLKKWRTSRCCRLSRTIQQLPPQGWPTCGGFIPQTQRTYPANPRFDCAGAG